MNQRTPQDEARTVRVPVNISIDERYRDAFATVVQRCKRAGLQVTHELRGIGILTGLIESARIERLERVEGVTHVEREQSIQIAPPESDIQ